MSRDSKSDGPKGRRVSATADATTDTDAAPDVTPAPSISQNAKALVPEGLPDNDGARFLRDHAEITQMYEGGVKTEEGMTEIARGALAVADALGSHPHALDLIGRLPLVELRRPEHASYVNTWTDEEEREKLAVVIPALRRLLLSADGMALLAVGGDWPPDEVYGHPRLALAEEAAWASPTVQTPAGPWAKYKCALTGRAFALPPNAPVPALLFDAIGPNGDVKNEPEDAYRYLVHPEPFVAGPEAVYRALWAHIDRKIEEAAEALSKAILVASAACYAWPENFKADVGTAYAKPATADQYGRVRGHYFSLTYDGKVEA